ncbi:MAG TPA: hypothetical protein VK812_18535 [Candidatus Binatus sp.]|jgi:hypothetical protein|nr:hypothetical protein [Candidatus Binatus sp.]HWY22034.1 hypothetical protein [Candidatus Acidoferrum sp.]
MLKVVIKTVTIRGTPVTFQVTAALQIARPTASDVPLTRVAPGVYSCNLPEGDMSIAATAESPDYWKTETRVMISPLPRIHFGTSGVGKTVDVDFGTNPITLTITLTMQKVSDVRQSMGISFGSPQTVMDFGPQILNPSGSGITLFNQTPTPAALLQQNLYMMKWKSSGTIVGVYVPQAAGNLGNYNVFFKPPRHGGWTTPGVTGLYMTWTGARDHKCLIAQTELSKSSYIVCFAFEEDGPLPAYGQHQSGLMELLEEIDYYLRLDFKGSADRPDVRNVALSCFSAGAEHVKNVCGGPGSVLLSKLKGLFILDGNDFDISSLANGNRAIRIYVAERKFNSVLNSPGSTVQGPNGSFEFHSTGNIASGNPAIIYLYVPLAFWHAYDPSFTDWMSVHQKIPGFFESHALKTSGI